MGRAPRPATQRATPGDRPPRAARRAADFQPFNYRRGAAQRGDPRVRRRGRTPPGARAAAGPLPAVPTLILVGGLDLRTPRRGRRRRRRADPGRPARRRALHRPLRRRQRPRRLRQERDGRLLRGPARGAVPERAAGHPRLRRSRRRASAACPAAPRRARRSPPSTATVRDVRLQFLGDEIAAGQTTRAGAKVGGLRSGHATATSRGYNLRRVEFVPGVVGQRLRPEPARYHDAHHQRRARPRTAS